jgi:teichuronic acid biosynthesis glycosyltransferase TuaC
LSAPLRVLCLTTLFPGPGRSANFGQFVARQFQALAERGDIDLTVINPLSGWQIEAFIDTSDTAYGYPVYRPRYWSIPRYGVRWNPARIAAAALPLAQKLHAARPFDLVDAQFFYPDGPAAARVAKALGLPLSIKARGSDIHYWGHREFARRQMLAAADRANGLLAVSEALKAEMMQMGIDGSKIAVHYTGLDHARFRPYPRGEARAKVTDIVPSDGPLLVSVGNLVPLKGHDLAIEAMFELPGVRLAIAGDGPEKQRLHEIATELGLSNCVTFCGALASERIADLLAAADAMILLSQSEGLANAWIEALACGTPLVITDVGGAREVVRDRSGGIVGSWHLGPEVATAVRDLLANPPPQAEVAAHAARFSWEANAAQLAEHYRLVAGCDPSRASLS